MPHYLDMEAWEHKAHFDFFKTFDEPFFGFVVNVDITTAYQQAKEMGVSFFLYYLHKSLQAANEIEAFRYRMQGDRVIVYDKVGISATIARPNGTFGFSYFEHKDAWDAFLPKAMDEVERVRLGSGLELANGRQDFLHCSTLPTIAFTGLSHARHFASDDSAPKLCFGKWSEVEGKMLMPMSVHAHHALMDSAHIGKFIARFQELLVQPI